MYKTKKSLVVKLLPTLNNYIKRLKIYTYQYFILFFCNFSYCFISKIGCGDPNLTLIWQGHGCPDQIIPDTSITDPGKAYKLYELDLVWVWDPVQHNLNFNIWSL